MRMHLGGRVAVILSALFFTTACGTTYAQGRGYPNYPNSRGGVYRGGGYANAALQRGFDDGYQQGLDAARDGDRYDVRRESWYRSADRGYDRRFGSRNQYQQYYRNGFTRGYDQGYRDGRYRNNGRYRRW
jgi:flagellar biosynthesis/type III secretory pathway protein FliH